jgi:hypothetical protein
MKVVVYLLVGVAALVVASVLVLWLLYGGSPWPTAPPRVEEGGQWLRVVRLKPWGLTVKLADGHWAVCQNFELRVLEEGGVKSVLIRGTFFLREAEFTEQPDGRVVMSRPVENAYSDEIYAVTLDGAARTREADEAAWSRARALTPEESQTEFGPGRHRMFSYDKGETLPRGGVTGGGLPLTSLELGGAEPSGWLLSQGGRYAAGFSHTSRRRLLKRPSLIPFGGEDDRIIAGTMYVDIFEGATGRRVARATQGHKESYDMYVFRQAVWFEGRYFLMPLDHRFEGWLVGALPE